MKARLTATERIAHRLEVERLLRDKDKSGFNEHVRQCAECQRMGMAPR